MALTPQQITLVHDSFRKVAIRADTTGQLFYDRLFELDPSLRPLFKPDMRDQRLKFIQTVGTLVASLNLPGKIEGPIQHLGQRHLKYSVEKGHYAVAGEALIWALEHVLGNDFTPDVREAWTELYGMISNIAIEAAYSA
jgi:hemoglobin-like flavoprotein